jgi:tRNA A-37 threonylcarbamoyl transferase component Bud32
MSKQQKDGGTTEEKDEEDSMSITEDVRLAEYYHGLIPRIDIEPLLRKEGDFLLRKTEHNPGVIILAISVRHDGNVKHFMVNQEENGFYFEQHHEKSVSELINWHRNTKNPLSSGTPAKLRRPVERPKWLLTHDAIKLVKKIGEGAFGEVYMADFIGPSSEVQVAVKTMREEVSREARIKFMKEARLMRKLQHPNIVKILGVAVHEHPIMIVIELCVGGSLLNHLRKNKNKLTSECKLRFCLEAASGLAYLEKQNFIHRDIAARNCLLSDKNELKISDFGMSDDRKQFTDDKLSKVPVKWLAPETMQTKVYNNKTDVWSFGVLVYEIYADGSEPYPGLTNIQTRAKIIVQNYRMDMPKDTPPGVSKLISKCWSTDPNARPTFEKIQETLKQLVDKKAK